MSKPNIADGWLGAQPKFSELKLAVDSHSSAQFKVSGDNQVKIKLKTGMPLKFATKFTQCSTDKDIPEHLLIQRKEKDEVRMHLSFPDNGFYKFQIFALEETNPAESCPNVYNYLIEVVDNGKMGRPLVKAYTKFYTDYCFLDEPLALNESMNLENVKFDLTVPGAEKVAVHCGEEWFHLTQRGSCWEGKANLDKYKGKKTKVTVNANYKGDGNSYSVLLEYVI